MPMKKPPFPAEDPRYPSSDGRPLAESDWQLHAILDAVAVLDLHFKDRPDVYVSGDRSSTTRRASLESAWRLTSSWSLAPPGVVG